jgi:hypothetical protein
MSVAKPSLAACRVDIVIRTLARWVAVALIVATTGAIAADARKTLHVAFPVAETGFDPQAIGDTYSDAVCLGIFDPLYTTIISRDPSSWSPTRPTACPRSPTTAAPTRSR